MSERAKHVFAIINKLSDTCQQRKKKKTPAYCCGSVIFAKTFASSSFLLNKILTFIFRYCLLDSALSKVN